MAQPNSEFFLNKILFIDASQELESIPLPWYKVLQKEKWFIALCIFDDMMEVLALHV